MRDLSHLELKYQELYEILILEIGETYADQFSDQDLKEFGEFLLTLAHGCTL